jgi:hypothetical protein
LHLRITPRPSSVSNSRHQGKAFPIAAERESATEL